MGFPRWDIPLLGGGMVIATIAIIHVVIAHFAIGAGIFIAYSEWRLRSVRMPVLERFLRDVGRLIILFSFIAGALTGVGIWFAIGLVSPAATGVLIHEFVWAWAAEWVLFAVEIAAGYLYYYRWGWMTRESRYRLALVYAAAAWGSLFIINGIISFMLTPGGWLETGSFWAGWLNPSSWPALLMRTVSALALGALFAIVIASLDRRFTREEERELVSHVVPMLVPLLLMVPFACWYYLVLPDQAKRFLTGGSAAMQMFALLGLAISLLIGGYAYIALVRNRRAVSVETAVLLVLLAFIATGAAEFVREGVRKPFLVYGYMYSNGLIVGQKPQIDREGVLSHAAWTVPEGRTPEMAFPVTVGRWVFRAECSTCHTVYGYNGIGPLVETWAPDLVQENLGRLPELKPSMPPFVGTYEEFDALCTYVLLTQVPRLPEITGRSSVPEESR